MRLIFHDPARLKDTFVINERRDSKDSIVRNGDTFEVSDRYGTFLLSHYFPRITEAPPEAVSSPETRKPEQQAKRAAD